MPKVNSLSKGNIVEIGGEPHIVRAIEAKSPSSRGAQTIYKIRYENLTTKQKVDKSHTGDEKVGDIDFKKCGTQFLYKDSSGYNFMDNEDYAQYTLTEEDLGEKAKYLADGQDSIVAYLVDDNLVDIELPPSVDLKIKQTDPAVKGNSSSGRKKSAVLESGLEVNIPEYLAEGDVIKINSETGKFMSRVE